MHRALAFPLFLCLAASAQDSPLVTALNSSKSTFQLEGSKLSGDAVTVLDDAARDAQFFLIGEDHGAAETPRFAAAMFALARTHGYRHIAIEAGPITGELLEQMARKANGVEEIGAFNRAHPFALPFFNWREETEYLVVAVHGNEAKQVVWGLDQEFMTSPAFLLERLASIAKTDAAKTVVAKYIERSISGYEEMKRAKNPRAALLSSMTPADFDELAAPFPRGTDGARIVDELRKSAAIYQLWFTPGENYRANDERARLMKQNFVAAYKQAQANGEAMPRVLMKFGATHMTRGRSMVNTYDLGTFLPELATLNGTHAFSVLLLARGGHVNALTPFSADESDAKKAYDPAKTRNLELDPAPFFAAAANDGWTLFDLRKVRPKMTSKILGTDLPLQRVIYGFDAVIVIPEATPSTSW
jgi:erythromycin esterase-like protein